MRKLIEAFLYGPRKVCLNADRVVCPGCGCRADFKDLVEECGKISCNVCSREAN